MTSSESVAPRPDLDILIVAYRAVDELADCLASVRKYLPDAAIRVWDNSGPDHRQVADYSADQLDIDWHLGSANIGFAAAVNRLVRVSRARRFLLLNPDAVLLSDLSLTRRLADGPTVAAVAPLIDDPSSTDEGAAARPWDVAHRAGSLVRAWVDYSWYSPRLRGTRFSSLYASAPHAVSGYLTGACLLINRTAWEAVGEFDEEFFLYGEESDWQRRARAAGFELLLADEPGVTHRGHGTVAGDPTAGLRSADLLRTGVALNLDHAKSVHHGDLYLAGTSLLDRVQRSRRRHRAELATARTTGRPAVIITTNRLVYGGAERQHVVLATELTKRGYPVTIVCMQRFGPLVSEIGHDIRIVRQPWWAPLVDLPPGPAVAITGDTNTETGFATLWRHSGRNRRWLVGAHIPPATGGPTYSSPLAAAMSRADGFVALSPRHWEQATAFQRLGARHFIAPNGVVTREQLAVLPTAAVRSAAPVRLAMLSRIVEHKNPQVLTAALARLTEFDWTLDIFGDGPDRDRLEAMTPQAIADRVRWRGWSPGPDHALADADLLCVPSRSEAFPLVIVEAMARGVPVAASAVCAVPDMLDHGRAGFLVPEPDVESWSDSLKSILAEPHRLPSVGTAGRDRMAERYTVDAMVDAYESALTEIF